MLDDQTDRAYRRERWKKKRGHGKPRRDARWRMAYRMGDARTPAGLGRPKQWWRLAFVSRYRYVRIRWCVLAAIIDYCGYSWLLAIGWIGHVCSFFRAVLGNVSRSSRAAAKGESRETIHSVLVVQLDHMGDAVLSASLLAELRAALPHATIEVLCSPWNQAIFGMMPAVNRVHVWKANRFERPHLSDAHSAGSGEPDPAAQTIRSTCIRPPRVRAVLKAVTRATASIRSWLHWMMWLRKRRFDLAIDIRGELPIALLLWLGNVSKRAGWPSAGGGFLLTHPAPYVPERPEAESREALLHALPLKSQNGSGLPGRQTLLVPQAAQQRIDRELSARNGPQQFRMRDRATTSSRVDREVPCLLEAEPQTTKRGTPSGTGRSLLALHIGAGTPAKQWPEEYWSELIRLILRRFDVVIALIGARSDVLRADRIYQTWKRSECATVGRDNQREVCVHNFVGQHSIEETAALLQRADVLVGADSGPAHLAATFGTPTVVLFSGTCRSRQWRPRGKKVYVLRARTPCAPCYRVQCPQAQHACMRGIGPAEVLAVLESMLDCTRPQEPLLLEADGLCDRTRTLPDGDEHHDSTPIVSATSDVTNVASTNDHTANPARIFSATYSPATIKRHEHLVKVCDSVSELRS